MHRTSVLLFALLLAAQSAWAAQRTFVSAASGDDTNPCTRLLPCRNFAAALPLTDPDGEIIVVDSGGYGVVTIAQAVSLISPAGVHGAITSFTGTAITINAGDTSNVVLKHLALSGLGGSNGITTNTAASVSIEDCTLAGFSTYAIAFFPTTAGSRLAVNNTTVENSHTGIVVGFGQSFVQASIESVVLDGVAGGIGVGNGQATVRNAVMNGSDPQGEGYSTGTGGTMIIDSSVAASTDLAFYAAFGSTIYVTRCTSTANGVGVYAVGSGSTILVSDSTIFNNGSGVVASSGGTVMSRGNNTLSGNIGGNTFPATYSAQ